ncbi:alpha/beta fold hydrolase [Vibrio superstes]|uniref:Alpha/beta hydrolase n=1 Tax=Vibrio superstes NBRC 103154 TaxID=1219062 RepID=A0A511QWJ5_9VIBR|nr:alpha/beta hydrolase [Vibrio superstes]GEM81744.1 alpha/beta hydrolase [Vibrio superstes NBRC 103154]
MENWSLPSTFEYEGRLVKYGIKGEGEPIVLVHGTPWSSFNLRHLIQELSSEYTVYYFDLLGYGESDKSDADVSLKIQNQLLEALLDHWQLKLPYIVGHDFGGTTVLRNHLLNKRKYKKIAVIDPVALSPWGSPFFKHIEKHEIAFAEVPDFIHAAIVDAYIKTAAYQPLSQATIDGILEPWSSEEGKRAFYRQIAQADSKYTDEFQDKFSEIDTPTLILWGEKDQWIPVEQAYLLHSKIKGSKLVTIPESGHLVIEEKPEILVKEIKAFFGKRI